MLKGYILKGGRIRLPDDLLTHPGEQPANVINY